MRVHMYCVQACAGLSVCDWSAASMCHVHLCVCFRAHARVFACVYIFLCARLCVWEGGGTTPGNVNHFHSTHAHRCTFLHLHAPPRTRTATPTTTHTTHKAKGESAFGIVCVGNL